MEVNLDSYRNPAYFTYIIDRCAQTGNVRDKNCLERQVELFLFH